MPPIASGVATSTRYKKEVTWGTPPSVGGAQLLRNVTNTLDLVKDTYQSQEKRTDYQVSDFRHGVRRAEGAINGEISPATYKDFMAAACRKDFVAGVSVTGASITVAGAGPTYTITRAAGSWITDGVKLGDIGRLTAGSFNAANLNKNVQIMGETATVLTVQPLNGVALVAEGPIAAATFAVTGKKTFVPSTAHTDDSFSIEKWFSDIAQSEVYPGCKLAQMDLAMPPTGMSTIAMRFMGKDRVRATSQYFTSPTAETTTGILAAVNGLLVVQNAAVALITGANISINGNMNATPVVGSNTYPDIFEGRVIVTGSLQAYFQDAALRDLFDDETEASLYLNMTTSNAATADFLSFVMHRLKVGGAGKDDGEKGIEQTLPFQALKNTAGGTGTNTEATTIAIQDSAA